MKRLFPRTESEAVALVSLLALALVAGSACEPDNKVKAGAPVLKSLSILEASGTRTDVASDTPDCATGAAEGGACDPTAATAAACRSTTTICHCVAKPEGDCSIDPTMPTTGGNWVCHYGPQAVVLAVFDRLIDTVPLDPGDAGGLRSDIVMFTTDGTPATLVTATADYNPNGSDVGLVFPVFFGVASGPSMLLAAQPATPAGANVKFTLDPNKVRAKDGKTPFSASGLLQGGALAFDTNPFGVSITVPVAPPPMPDPDAGTADDGGADGGAPDTDIPEVGAADALAEAGTDDGGGSDGGADGGATCVPPPVVLPEDVPPSLDPVTITFNNPVDGATIASHITVTSNGTPIPAADLTIDAEMAPTVTVTPKANWPASATIVITVDATASDVLGSALGAAATASFTTTSGT